MKKNAFIIALFIITMASNAQVNNNYSLKLDHIAISVKDVEKSVAFYKNILNLEEITNKTKKEGIRWMSLNDGKELHLISTIKGEVVLNKAVHIAFTISNIDALLKELNAKNIIYSDWSGKINTITTRADGVKQIYFQDPDGYWIEINTSTTE
ncbi:VOC family protein [Flavobacterium sp.]|uniref:VOC family protein n=1 Tax=Flavobacterium sp. TaxID=239 RepID=UPI003751E608